MTAVAGGTGTGDGAGTGNSDAAIARQLCVLAIDTSTEACSAALLRPDGSMTMRCVMTERSHADLILPMIDELLREAGIRLGGLDGLAFGRGPGSFTGLRVAAGVIQGLAYGAGLPVAPVSSLAAVALQVLSAKAEKGTQPFEKGTQPFSGAVLVDEKGCVPFSTEKGCVPFSDAVLVCNDARMNEVYWGCFQADTAGGITPVAITREHVGPAATIIVPPAVRHCAGNGFAREPALLARLQDAGLTFHAGLFPRADAIARMGAAMLQRGEGVAAGEALPTYVRDDVARAAQRPVTGV
jgi:tRNA threonylcarbamoyladenosine biosynthesis protein TsaB